MSRCARSAATGAGWVAFLGASLVALHRLGPMLPLRPPTGGSYEAWLAASGPAPALVGAGRLVALGMGGYLLLSTLLLGTVRLLGWGRGVEAVEAVVPRIVRRVVHGAVGLTLLAAPAPALASASPTAPALRSSDAIDRDGNPAGGAITMRRLQDPGSPTAEPPAPPTPPGRRTWTIAPGEHLWSIAERVLAEHLGRAPTDGEVDPYWRTLVDVNRPRLPRPDVPDLVFPGEVIDVPVPPPPGV